MTLQHRQESLRKAQAAIDGIDRTQLIEDVLTKVVIDSLGKYQQKVAVGVQDSISDLLENFKLQVASEIFDIAQNWTLSTKREKLLFPQDCRFLYTIGRSTIVVIEERPGIRSLSMDKSLLGERRQTTRHGDSETITLALPYVVFVLHFRNDVKDGTGQEQFCGLYTGWRQSSLMTLDNSLAAPLLPNTHTNLSVCTGQDVRPGENMVDMTQRVINHYWSSTFNTDLSTFWWDKSQYSPHLKHARKWAETSRNNPCSSSRWICPRR